MAPDDRLAEVYDRGSNNGFETLSEAEQGLYRIQEFILDFEMGGLSGYFYNRFPFEGDITATIAAMDNYGLRELADVLHYAHELLRPDQKNRDAKTWGEILGQKDPKNELSILEKRIDSIENYGIDNSSIM